MESSARERSWGRMAIVAVFLGAVVVLLVSTLFATRYVTLWEIFNRYVDGISNTIGFNPYLVAAGSVVLFVPFVVGAKFAVSIRRDRRLVGIGILLTMFVGYNVALYYLTRTQNFGFSAGEPLKWYAITPDGVRFYDRPGRDPKYDIELRPITGDLVEQLELLQKGQFTPVQPTAGDFFSPLTGKPQLWYYRDTNGVLEFYDKPVFHPGTGKRLDPVTPEVFLEWKKRNDEDRIAAAQEVSAVATRAAADAEATRTAATAGEGRPVLTPSPPPPSPTVHSEPGLDPSKVSPRLSTEERRVQGFVFRLLGCSRRGDVVECHITVANLDAEPRRLAVCGMQRSGMSYDNDHQCMGRFYCRAFDEDGNEYVSRKIQFGSREGTGLTSNLLSPGVPVKVTLTFDDVPDLVARLNSVEIGLAKEKRGEEFPVRFQRAGIEPQRMN